MRIQDGPLTPPQTPVRLHAYAASFGGDFARESISENMERGWTLLDPWVGSGTGPVQARLLGISGIGIDVDPVACLIARVSLTPYGVDELDEISARVERELKLIEAELYSSNISTQPLTAGYELSLNRFHGIIPKNDAIDFWFDPIQRAVLALLVSMSNSIADPKHQSVVRLAISSSIIRKWPNTISLARDIDHSRPHKVVRNDVTIASQIGIFRKTFRDILGKLKALNAYCLDYSVKWEIIEGDSKELLDSIPFNSIDYILTSPPYFNAIDYPRSHKFSQWWLWPDSQPLGRSAYLGLMSGSKDADDLITNCRSLVPSCRESIDAISKVSSATHRNLCKYIVELYSVVVKFAGLLKHGGKSSFVVGNNVIKDHVVPMADILASMLEASGLECVSIDERTIRTDRRRYPFGVAGFKGLMTSEFVVRAHKPETDH